MVDPALVDATRRHLRLAGMHERATNVSTPVVADPLASLLRTKLGIRPRPRGVVTRSRLQTALDRAVDARLILVSAPAGFGKSTLLADWLTSGALRSAWVSLDAGDNDVIRFTACLCAAAAELAGRPAEEGAFVAARPFDGTLAVARAVALLREDSVRTPRVLVLDDYHVIEEPEVHRVVASLIAYLPRGIRLAVATRADPQLPLARLRATGEFLEIRADDLAFRPAEAGQLLRGAGLDLTPGEIDLLTSRTEGWAAALRLAAAALQDRPGRDELVRGFGATHRYLLDYIIEEVLARLPDDTQEFLLRTSILERMTGSLCDAVTGGRDGQACLEALERANLLVIPLDDQRRWYRYHGLFREVLRNRLSNLHRDEVADLHRRASQWHREEGHAIEAIEYAVRSGDVEHARTVLDSSTFEYLNRGELSMVRRWLDALPPTVVRADPHLSASYAWCLVLAGETAGVEERLADMERGMADPPGHEPLFGAILPPELALLRSRLAGLGKDTTTEIEQARLALTLLPPGLPPYVDAIIRGNASVLIADALLASGDTEAAVAAYEAALPDLRAGGNGFGAAHAVASLAEIDLRRPDPAAALARCELHLGAPGEPTRVADGAVWIAKADALAQLGMLEEATIDARRGLDLVSRSGASASARTAKELLERIAHKGTSARAQLRSGDLGTPESLTDREIEILQLVARGHSNRQIAARLVVALGTVKSHLHSISEKLGASNRTEAVARGRDRGLLG